MPPPTAVAPRATPGDRRSMTGAASVPIVILRFMVLPPFIGSPLLSYPTTLTRNGIRGAVIDHAPSFVLDVNDSKALLSI